MPMARMERHYSLGVLWGDQAQLHSCHQTVLHAVYCKRMPIIVITEATRGNIGASLSNIGQHRQKLLAGH